MNIALKIKTLCCNSININSIDVINESHLHNTPLNSETHFKLIIVTDDFVGLKLIERHKKVHKVLARPSRSYSCLVNASIHKRGV
jgi:stress-induced morphogen